MHDESPHPEKQGPLEFADVIADEIFALRGKKPLIEESTSKERRQATLRAANAANLSGIALSGGGVRSATFNLGLIQALAKIGIIQHFDYLSTVSGGGYIGGWLQALLTRNDPLHSLKNLGNTVPGPQGYQPVRHLGIFSSYLTPGRQDKLTAFSIYLINLIINAVIILFLIIGGILTISAILKLINDMIPWFHNNIVAWITSPYAKLNNATIVQMLSYRFLPLAIGTSLLIFSMTFMVLNLGIASRTGSKRCPSPNSFYNRLYRYFRTWLYSSTGWNITIILPTFLGFAITASWFANEKMYLSELFGIWVAGVLMFFVPWAIAVSIELLSSFWRDNTQTGVNSLSQSDNSGQRGNARYTIRPSEELRWLCRGAILSIPVSIMWTICCFTLFYFVSQHARYTEIPYLSKYPINQMHTLLGPVWIVITSLGLLFVYFLCTALHIGSLGKHLPDKSREFWASLWGRFMITAVIWIGVSTIYYIAPVFLINFPVWSFVIFSALLILCIWIAKGLHKTDLAAQMAGIVTLSSLLIIVFSLICIFGYDNFINETYHKLYSDKIVPGTNGVTHIRNETSQALTYLNALVHVGWGPLILSAVLFLVFANTFALTVSVNLFSLHNFYRNRLTKCYLGASGSSTMDRDNCDYNPADDLPLNSVRPDLVQRDINLKEAQCGLYPIFNATLNLAGTTSLALRKRRGTSFIFTPQYCGYEMPAAAGLEERAYYRPTENYAFTGGPSLGDVMAISGAAVSSSMGTLSKPGLSLLLTLINARLGQWWGNPSHKRTWCKARPLYSPRYLFTEMLGNTSEDLPYVYLSDGGHFDNLGLHELVRRNCRFIIVSDASCDPDYKFSDLINAIRFCEVDLGIPIEIDLSPLKGSGLSQQRQAYAAVGNIRYDIAGSACLPGILIYIKASLKGDEPTEILQYSHSYPVFPHDSTADQWFDEAQFETYRQLGYHIGLSLLEGLPVPANRGTATDSGQPTLQKVLERWTSDFKKKINLRK